MLPPGGACQEAPEVLEVQRAASMTGELTKEEDVVPFVVFLCTDGTPCCYCRGKAMRSRRVAAFLGDTSEALARFSVR